MKNKKNYAFIDSQNLNLGIRDLGWILDFARFRRYLTEKYSVNKAYLFIGFIESNINLYRELQEMGYVCIFKPTLKSKDGKAKGNCDAELVLQAMIDIAEYDSAIIVSGDGDFYCLVKYLLSQNKLGNIMVPNQKKFSALLKHKELKNYLRYVDDLKQKVELKKKSPREDKTSKGNSSIGDTFNVSKNG